MQRSIYTRLAIILAGAFLTLPLMGQGTLKWGGTIYTKWLDGNRLVNDALYNNSEFGNGDVGQGTEFEMLFSATVSRQVEIGGRLKARFDRNFWTNGGGFADDELEPRSAQYVKFRGVYVRLTPGYKWLDSATIGSNDWGQFDPWTVGKIRYIDRDNVSGLLFQGSVAEKKGRWDFARVSLPKLWAGPDFSTGPLHQKDAAYAVQFKYDVNNDFNFTLIGQYLNDVEIDLSDIDNRDGVETTDRFTNTVFGAKFRYSGGQFDVSGAFYSSDHELGVVTSPRWTPTLTGDDDDTSFKLNVDINDVGPFSFNIEYFDIGASYFSMMAARRESDVLLTEGHEGTWGWSRPDYNVGSNTNGASRAGIGYGGWDGASHQVVAINADNDFTDFDETMAESVLGWKGFTIVPKLTLGNWDLAAEYSYIDYNTNWQGYDRGGADNGIWPRLDGTRGWGLGGDWRSPFTSYQEKETTIIVLKGETSFDVGEGIDFSFKYKMINDEDERVTTQAGLADAYRLSFVGDVAYDDREADYTSFVISAGYQLQEDTYGSLTYEYHEVDLFDGTIDVTPPSMESWEPGAWIEYLTGQHEKDKLTLKIKYFLSGMEFGLNTQWIDGTYTPEFFTGNNGTVTRFNPTTPTVDTAVGTIEAREVDFDHYRLKAFMKVQF
ncbi:MAG: hypothetical protein QNK37_11625 [Acidobacteriota bacterium]|nr:hypothetical protein [Acidobacteriota bacterium]